MPGINNQSGGTGDQARDGLEPCPRDELVRRLGESAKMLADFAVQEERPTLTGFGINLLHSSIVRAIGRIEADQSSLDTMAGRIEALADNLERVTNAAENLAGELRDPGTEALSAIYCARAALRGERP
jgi:hypothetical protein